MFLIGFLVIETCRFHLVILIIHCAFSLYMKFIGLHTEKILYYPQMHISQMCPIYMLFYLLPQCFQRFGIEYFFLVIHHSIFLILNIKAIHSIRFENKFLGLVAGYAIEDDI